MILLFRRSTIHPIILFIIGLAGVGLLFRLINDPLGLVSEIFIAAVIVGVIFVIYKVLMQKRVGGSNGASIKYQKAVKQSKKRFNDTSNHLTKVRGLSQKTTSSKKPLRSTQSTKRRDHNFTVIDGKKGKKKNRALF